MERLRFKPVAKEGSKRPSPRAPKPKPRPGLEARGQRLNPLVGVGVRGDSGE